MKEHIFYNGVGLVEVKKPEMKLYSQELKELDAECLKAYLKELYANEEVMIEYYGYGAIRAAYSNIKNQLEVKTRTAINIYDFEKMKK